MNLTVLDRNFRAVNLIDTFKSAIWTDRYSSCGDFELFTMASRDILDIFLHNYYVQTDVSDMTMIIDGIELSSDPESGDDVKITGRSLVSMLDRRIVWDPIKYSGNIQDGIHKILDENVIKPKDPKRVIPNFIFKESTDKRILETMVDFEAFSDNVYDFIQRICSEKKIGFKIMLSPKNEFVFSLYMGTDRSYSQSVLPPVIFSPKFENIISSNYLKTVKGYKNVSLVSASSGDNSKKVVAIRKNTNDSGLDRFEMFTSGDSNKTEAELMQKGMEDLDANKGEDLFEGEVDSIHTYQYGIDFQIGDVIQMENAYGMSSKTRVTEFVRSESDSGIETYPSFEVVE